MGRLPGVAMLFVDVGDVNLVVEATELVLEVVFLYKPELEFKTVEGKLVEAEEANDDSDASVDVVTIEVWDPGSVRMRPVHGNGDSVAVGDATDTSTGDRLKIVDVVAVFPMLST